MSSSADQIVTPSFRLDGKVAVVTGAGRGLGRACSQLLALAGAKVVAVSRTEDDLTALVDEITEAGGEAEALALDVTDDAAVLAGIGGMERIDILVNNAGANRPQPFLDVPVENLDLLLNLNVRAMVLVAQSPARVMVEAGNGGSIINMSSQMGHVGAPIRTVYCMTKHGIEGLTKAMACDLAEHNIRVNTVSPTFADTPMTRPFFEDEAFKKAVFDNIPLKRLATMQDIANAVLYLASPAASFMTGDSMRVDGGWNMG